MSVCVKESGQLIKTAGLYRSEVPIGIADIYTNEERQVGIYTNGKPLYQKTYIIENTDISSGTTVLITLNNIIEVKNMRGEIHTVGSNKIYELPYIGSTGHSTSLIVNADNEVCTVCYQDSWASSTYSPIIITLQYTKSSDTNTGALPNSSSSIYMMGDVSISSPQDGQALVFDATDNKWKNGEGGGGGTANIWAGTQEELEEEFDEIPDDTQIVVYDDYQEVVDGGTIYSEDEQIIGLWTDNKPLYQKTLSIGALPNNGSKYISIGYLTNEIRVVEITGVATNTAQNTSLALPRAWLANDNTRYFVDLICVANNGYASVRIFDAIDYSAYNETYITVKYTKTADAPLDVTIGKSTVYIASSDCYSTEEKEVGCATNGKPLYQKTILHTGTFTGSNDLQTIAHNISNLDECVSVNGFIYDAHETNPSWMPLPRFYTSNAFGISHITTSDIYIYIPSAFGTRLRNARITLQYTKTTDTAGSGSYTPANGKAVHYSTDEQVIGTWIDGSTLYQKVITGTTNANTDMKIIEIGDGCVIRDFRGVIGGARQINSYVDNLSSSITWIAGNSHQLGNVCTGSIYQDKSFYVIVEYTKSS